MCVNVVSVMNGEEEEEVGILGMLIAADIGSILFIFGNDFLKLTFLPFEFLYR
jgi:hypothetical protein